MLIYLSSSLYITLQTHLLQYLQDVQNSLKIDWDLAAQRARFVYTQIHKCSIRTSCNGTNDGMPMKNMINVFNRFDIAVLGLTIINIPIAP